MLNSISIHIALLGIILGSGSAYVFSTYKAEISRNLKAAQLAESIANASSNHSDITDSEMIALFDQALDENPENTELKRRYGNFLFTLKRYGKAVEMYRLVLQNSPNDAVVRTDMGTALYNLGRINEAMANYKQALEFDPTNILALHNIAIAELEALGDLQAGKKTIQRIEEINPNYAGLQNLYEILTAADRNLRK